MDRCSTVSYLYELGGPGQGGPGCGGGMIAASNGMIGGDIHETADLLGETYCLKWNEFERKFSETFRVLRENDSFTDVTLVSDGHSVKAHRLILSACSSYFHAILKSIGPWQHPVLVLQDVRAADLVSLMDFIYLGQANIKRDALDSFLKVAKKLKIKGLCENHDLPVQAPSMMQRKEMMGCVSGISPPPQNVSHQTFESLMPRGSYIQQDSVTPFATQQMLSRAAAPPAHQSSPKQSRPSPSIREHLMYISPKRTKYVSMSPQFLRNQLQMQRDGDLDTQQMSCKQEPIAILSHQEEVSSAVSEFMTSHENDLALSNIGHGISPQFMFSPDPDGQVQNGQSAALVAIDDRVTRLETVSSVMSAGSNSVVSPSHNVALLGGGQHHLHSHLTHHSIGGPQSIDGHGDAQMDEPQDLTPTQDSQVTHTPPMSMVSNHSAHGPPTPVTPTGHVHQVHHQVVQTPNSLNNSLSGTNNSSSSLSSTLAIVSPSTTPTPPKKDRNTRKSCSFCHKDFHEMSLKRHIKDVHMKSQNQCVICPQCGKQYASQNSLYSHLNRVHGFKKDAMSEIPLQIVAPHGATSNGGGDDTNMSIHHQQDSRDALIHHQQDSRDAMIHHQQDSRDAIMDLAQHSSDNSN